MSATRIAAGFVCAGLYAAAAGATAAQQGTAAGDGLFESYRVELNGTRGHFVSVGNVPVSQETGFSSESAVDVPELWEERSFDELVAGPSSARSSFEASIESSPTMLSGRLDVSAEAFSEFDGGGSSSRVFHDLNIAAENLDVVGNVIVRLDGSASVGGFGRSTLTYVFRSDEFTERGSIREDLSGGINLLFENVQLSFFDISLTARTEAGTDSPVTNASADLTADWSVEIFPIPTPGSAVGVGCLGLLALRRRR
ncbi:MAG: hypothetical protein AAFY46_02875 [Planctomycetota bacterium]